MAKIVWLASYPKSGNTWMRVLLANYLRDGEDPVDINEIGIGPIASARACFDERAGIEASALDDSVIEELRPEVFRYLVKETPDNFYMKVHDAWRRTSRGEALFPPDVTAGVVYLLRNPLDLAPSCARHWGVSLEKAVWNLCDPDFALARSYDGLRDQLRQTVGSWTAHARSWIDESGLPVHLVRYEDLSRTPEKIFGEVVRFCGLPWDLGRVKKAVAFSEFSELQRQEQRSGFRERPMQARGNFFRRGQVGSWRDELPAVLAMQLIESHRDSMRRFGYWDEEQKGRHRVEGGVPDALRSGLTGGATC
jgi:Sulfotransferase domain